jgi:hypothetical protein
VRLLVLLALCACARSPEPPPGAAGPVEAVQELSEALRKGDTGTAWSLLSQRTRDQADKLAAVARAHSDAGPESGREMLFSSALQGRALEARDLSITGDSADVQTFEDGGPPRIWRVVREGGRWRVELSLDTQDGGARH